MPAVARGRAESFRRLRLAAALVVGLALAVLGVAQTASALLQVRAADALKVLRAAPPGSLPDAVAAIKADLERADAWWRDPVNGFTIATLSMRFTLPDEAGDADRALAAAARRDLERSLAAAPGNAEAWIWLATARLIEQGRTRPSIDAFSMSIALAPYDPALLVWRCQTGLALYPALDDLERDNLAEQIRMLEDVSADDLVRVAFASKRMDAVVAALGDDTAALAHFAARIKAR